MLKGESHRLRGIGLFSSASLVDRENQSIAARRENLDERTFAGASARIRPAQFRQSSRCSDTNCPDIGFHPGRKVAASFAAAGRLTRLFQISSIGEAPAHPPARVRNMIGRCESWA